MELGRALTDLGLTFAEYAVLWHVRDTVVVGREDLAIWVCQHLPNTVPQDLSLDDCRSAVDALVRKKLLIELTEGDIESDLARWRSESLPVSWGVDRDRRVGDVDLTDDGFRAEKTIGRLTRPSYAVRPVQGYNDEVGGLIRVFGETAEACEDAARHLVDRIDQDPWRWSRDSIQIEPVRSIGPWWVSRFERVPTGFEIALRRS